MKKIALVLVIFSLILYTAIIKNSAKKNEDKIFAVKENIRILNSELEKIKLEFDYLSSSDKLLEFQSLYFENDLIQKKIENIKVFKITNKDKLNISFELSFLKTPRTSKNIIESEINISGNNKFKFSILFAG